MQSDEEEMVLFRKSNFKIALPFYHHMISCVPFDSPSHAKQGGSKIVLLAP